MARFEKYFMRLQNGNDVRGAAIATESEERTLTEGLVTFIANAFAAFLAEKLGKARSDLRIGIGHDSRVTADVLMAAARLNIPTVFVSGGRRGLDVELSPADLAALTEAVFADVGER